MRWWMARIGGASVLLLLTLAWLLLAPTQVGGQATYVMTEGVSMLPTYHTGDLVILRREHAYEVGDVVAYVDPDIGQVFHRIVARDGDRFVTKGDNNPKPDVFHPGMKDILGRLWLFIPGGGRLVLFARQPAVAASISGGAVLMATLPVATKLRKRRRFWHRNSDGGPGWKPPRPTAALGPVAQGLAITATFVGLLAAAGLLVSSGMPLQRQEPVNVPFEHLGTFSYSAVYAPAGLYDTTSARTGDPIYRDVTPMVGFRFDYDLEAQAPADVHGTIRLDAIVRASDGWTRTIPMAPARAFSGPVASAEGPIDLNDIDAMLARRDRLTGLATSNVDVDIVPTVSLTGSIDGSPVSATFAPSFSMHYNAGELATQSPLGASESSVDPIHPRAPDATSKQVTVANTVAVLGLNLSVEPVRTISSLLLLTCLLLGLVLAALAWFGRQADESARIQARYGHMLVALRGSALGKSGRAFEVATIEDLVRVAIREGRMILHEVRGVEHSYTVQDAEVTYRYRTSDAPAAEAGEIAEESQ